MILPPRPFHLALLLAVTGWAVAPILADEPTIPGVGVTADVVYGHKDGLALTYDVFRPESTGEGRGPCLILIVSGGWVSQWMPPEAMLPFTKPLLDRGYTVCAVRHGSSPKYQIPEIVDDVRKALVHVSEHAADLRIDPARIGIFGFSAGGHLSLMLGTTTNAAARGRDDKPRVAAVAAVFPPTDLAPYVEPAAGYLERFPALKFPREQADSYSPLKQVSDDDAPTLLVHGDKDELVPLWHSERIRDALRASNVDADLLVIEGAAHGFDADGNRRMFEAMLDWFDKHLAPRH
jgi:acetyl esterase/lipase